ncbi:MAG TPA: hypothetical protein VFW40_07560, partial [Capsulimonadaceae bacterium]|nr:hypothetical protein [Capsulimonadaceae bacterium]
MITICLFIALFVIALCLPAFATGGETALGPALKGPTTTVPRYGKFEAPFKLADTSGNPFDPADNDVWAIF